MVVEKKIKARLFLASCFSLLCKETNFVSVSIFYYCYEFAHEATAFFMTLLYAFFFFFLLPHCFPSTPGRTLVGQLSSVPWQPLLPIRHMYSISLLLTPP